MVQFAAEYPALFEISQPPVAKLAEGTGFAEISQPPVDQSIVGRIPWAHNVLLMQKLKEQGVRLWYACQTLEKGRSRDTLAAMIRSAAHAR